MGKMKITIPDNRHSEFAQYCVDNGITEIETKMKGTVDDDWRLISAVDCAWRDDFDVRIPGDIHWKLRLKWINSDKALPIEIKAQDGSWLATPLPLWLKEQEYREAEIKEQTDVEFNPVNAGLGNVLVGSAVCPETGVKGIAYLRLPEVSRRLNADCSDIYPDNSQVNAKDVLACIYFHTPEAIQQSIDVLIEVQKEMAFRISVCLTHNPC
jgi:hypothetical protein